MDKNIWNNNNDSQIPDSWKINSNRNNIPDSWEINNDPSDIKPEKTSINLTGLADKMSSGASRFKNIAGKTGAAIKNTAANAAEYARSDEVQKKINTAKDKMNSFAGGVADNFSSAVSHLKETAEENDIDLSTIVSENTKPFAESTAEHVPDEDISRYPKEQEAEPAANTIYSEPINSEKNIITDEEIISGLNDEQKTAFAELPDDKQQMVIDMRRKQLGDIAASTPEVQAVSDAPKPPVQPTQSYSAQDSEAKQLTQQYPSYYSQPSQNKNTNTVTILLLVIVILLLGIAVFILLFLVRDGNTAANKEPAVSSAAFSEYSSLIAAEKEEIIPTETIAQNIEVQNAPSSDDTVVKSLSKDEIYGKYLEIINGMDFVKPYRGFLTDLNGDGVNEMIVPEVSDMTYKLYYHDEGSVKSCSFGSFMALDNFVMFSVEADDGKKYIYYRDNYSYKSKQGYFSFGDMSEIDIFLNFPSAGSGTADWTIDYNGSENFAKGTDTVNKVYGETKLESFRNYGFAISDSSKYSSLDGLYYDDLVKQLR